MNNIIPTLHINLSDLGIRKNSKYFMSQTYTNKTIITKEIIAPVKKYSSFKYFVGNMN